MFRPIYYQVPRVKYPRLEMVSHLEFWKCGGGSLELAIGVLEKVKSAEK
jgi:hypothetical protein